ncbi:MAG: protein kinase [Candidatus Cloacimonetes bacterium HGW-Cloacimonetes-3]|jgi:formylglycine-generating enzyme required for sulfatase activity|nr:MAG: protein kinase [Candidatus Cloacimonetes bacterium HGW-Cloacimonetes-3]
MSEATSLNSYQVLESIHRSRRFSLYLATKYDSSKEVLIKTPDPIRSKDNELIHSLLAEAAACTTLKHPNIRTCYESAGNAGGAFLIGEYIPGISLAGYLKQASSPLDMDTVIGWFMDILEALVHAHSMGIRHLNLNPHNLMVTKENHIKIIGFGKDKAAWMHGEQEDFDFHPILFIAPELFQAGIELPASDIYSVAVIMYLCICKVMPWRIDYSLGSVQQKKQSLCRAVIMPEILNVQMPDWLYGIILNCLKLDPHQRIQSAAEMLDAISSQGSSMPADVPEESPVQVKEPILATQPEPEPFVLEPEPKLFVLEPEPSLVVADIEELTVEPEPEPDIPVPLPETQFRVMEPAAPPAKPAAPRQSMYSAQPMRRKELPDAIDNKKLSKTFKTLLWMSLLVLVFTVLKYFVFSSRPKFNLPADSMAVEEATSNPIEANRPIKMVLMPADTLVMGSIAPLADDDEFPLITVRLAPFYISATEITQEEWMMVFSANPSQNKDKDYPVESVSFYDAIDFCNAKSLKDGFRVCYDYFDTEVICNFNADGYRLPTEAEWESAARAGMPVDMSTYSGGNNADDLGWHSGNSGAHSHPVGKKKPNSLDLYDLSGNVYEWVWNWYALYSYRIPDLFKGAETGTDKVIRGGSWYHSSSEMRVTNRSFAKPYTKSAYIGFRVVRSVQN